MRVILQLSAFLLYVYKYEDRTKRFLRSGIFYEALVVCIILYVGNWCSLLEYDWCFILKLESERLPAPVGSLSRWILATHAWDTLGFSQFLACSDFFTTFSKGHEGKQNVECEGNDDEKTKHLCTDNFIRVGSNGRISRVWAAPQVWDTLVCSWLGDRPTLGVASPSENWGCEDINCMQELLLRIISGQECKETIITRIKVVGILTL